MKKIIKFIVLELADLAVWGLFLLGIVFILYLIREFVITFL